MARNSNKRPHELTLELFSAIGIIKTPEEIDKHVNNGAYSSKHIWFLRKLGYTFDAVKEGRTIKSYTLTGEPDNTETIRAGRQPKAKKTPVVKKSEAKKVSTKKVATKKAEKPKAKAVPKKTPAPKKTKVETKKVEPKKTKKAKDKPLMDKITKVKKVEDVLEEVPESATFSVDPDFDDSGFDVRDLL